MYRALVILAVIVGLPGCVVVTDDYTRSSFGAPPPGLSDVQTESLGNGFGSVTLTSGTIDGDAAAYARLVTTSAGSPLPASDATFTGTYEVVGIRDIRYVLDLFDDDFVTGTNFTDSGTVSLTADMSANTLTGTDGTLFVLGTLSGSDVSGTVTYDGQSGTLDGALYAEGGVAAFHGNNDSRVFAGGITMEDQP